MPKAYFGEMQVIAQVESGSSRREAAEHSEIRPIASRTVLTCFVLRWSCVGFWSILDIVTVSGVTPHGHAPTLDEVKAKFRDNWSKAKTG
jgi:hypothetical protein